MAIENYLPILLFIAIATGLACAILGVSWLRGKRNPYDNKNAPYECGFDPVTKEPGKFDIRFYMVGILFVIFDVEIAFLFPWAISLGKIGAAGFFSMVLFLVVLMIGFVYEWMKGALDWE